MTEKFKDKVIIFNQLLKDAYRDEEERGQFGTELELNSDSITEDFTAMVYGMHVLFKELTEQDEDIIGFTHALNRLVVQDILEDKLEDNQ